MIEIFPVDGSIIRSSGLTGHLFTHFIYKDGKVSVNTNRFFFKETKSILSFRLLVDITGTLSFHMFLRL